MLHTRRHVLSQRGEVHIGDTLLLTVLPDNGSNSGIVGVRDARKDVVLNLIVQASVEPRQLGAAHVGSRYNLTAQEGGIVLGVLGTLQEVHTIKVVRDDEKESQVVASHHEAGQDVQQGVDGGEAVERNNQPAETEEQDSGSLEGSVALDQLGHLRIVHALDDVDHRVADVSHAEERQQDEHIDVLQQVLGLARLQRIKSEEMIAGNIGILVDIIGVNVVLNHMLVNPIQGRATNPILSESQNTINKRIAGDSAVVGIVLNIQTKQSEEPTIQTSQIPLVGSGGVNVVFKTKSSNEKSSDLNIVAEGSKRLVAR